MDTTTAALITLCVLALVALGFLAVFRGRGELEIDAKKGKLKAKGENPLPPAVVPPGVKIKDAEAGKDVRAHAVGTGGVELEKVKAKGSIEATHQEGETPPKV